MRQNQCSRSARICTSFFKRLNKNGLFNAEKDASAFIRQYRKLEEMNNLEPLSICNYIQNVQLYTL
jgi:hypothetical protein